MIKVFCLHQVVNALTSLHHSAWPRWLITLIINTGSRKNKVMHTEMNVCTSLYLIRLCEHIIMTTHIVVNNIECGILTI